MGLVLIFQMSFGQKAQKEFKFKLGPVYKEKKFFSMNVIGADNKKVFVSKQRYGFGGYTTTRLEYAFFNRKTLSKIKDFRIPLKYQKKKLQFSNEIYLNNQLHLFTTFKNRKTKKLYLFHQTVNKKTMSFNNDLKKINEIDYSKFGRLNAGDFGYEVSSDSTKLMISSFYPYDRKGKEKMGFTVLNQNMEKIWEKVITFPFMDKYFEISDYYVNNKGNVYLLGKSYHNKKAKNVYKDKINYNYTIYAIYDKGNRLERYDINLKDKIVNDLKIVAKDDNISCAGLYAILKKPNFIKFFSGNSGYVNGSFFLRIDAKTKKIVAESYKEFDLELQTKYAKKGKKKRLKKKAAKGDPVQMKNYEITDIVVKDDGGIIAVAEQQYEDFITETYRTKTGTTTRTKTIYNFDNIIAINIDKNGQIVWNQVIKKTQGGVNRYKELFSYYLIVHHKNLYFLFNDKDKQSKGIIKKRVIKIVKIDQKGKMTENILYHLHKKDFNIIPKGCQKVDKNKYMLVGKHESKKRYHLAELTFTD